MDQNDVLKCIATIAVATLDDVHGAQHELNDLMRARMTLIRDLAAAAVKP